MHAPLAHPGSRALLIGANASRALESAHTPAEKVPADAQSFFLCHAEDDATVPVGNTIELRAAVRARGMATEKQERKSTRRDYSPLSDSRMSASPFHKQIT